MLYSIISIAAIIFEYMVTVMFIRSFMHEKNIKSYIKIIRPVVFCALVYCANQIVKIPAIMAVISLIIYYMVALFFEGSIKKRCFVSIGYMALILMSELITVVVLLLGGSSVQNMLEDYNMYRMLGTVVSKIVLLCLIRIIVVFSNKKQKIYLNYWLALLTVPAINLILLLIITAFLYNISRDISIPILVSVTAILYTIILVFWLFDKLTSLFGENSLLGNQIVFQAKQSEKEIADSEHIKSVSHDLKNHFQVIYKMLKYGKNTEAKNYVEALGVISDEKENTFSTGNISLDSVLSSKKAEAEAFGINMCSSITIPENMRINNVDECILLGNLLDNAIEACQRCENDEKRIDIRLKYSGNYLTCAVKNTAPYDIRLRDGELVTSKKDLSEHGIGIKNINKIITKYDGTLKMYMKDGFFNVQIILFVS